MFSLFEYNYNNIFEYYFLYMLAYSRTMISNNFDSLLITNRAFVKLSSRLHIIKDFTNAKIFLEETIRNSCLNYLRNIKEDVSL